MKPDEKKDIVEKPAQPATQTKADPTTVEVTIFFILILMMCLTLIMTTRMYVDSALISDMITHYSLRGKDVVVKDNQLVFVNN